MIYFRRAFIFSAAFSFGAITGSVAYGQKGCEGLPQGLEADVLYVRPCSGCGVRKVEADDDNSVLKLKRGQSYRYYFRTAQTQVQNSLVVIQAKHSGVAARPAQTPRELRLARDAIPFACRGFAVDGLDAAPRTYSGQDDETPESGLRVDYDKYDSQMRYGPDGSDVGKVVRNFHVSYSPDGRLLSCVSSLDSDHRPHFLFQDRGNVPDGRLAARLGLVTTAVAAPADPSFQKFEQFRLVLTGYSKKPQEAACLSFVVRARGSALELSLADIQRKIWTRRQGGAQADFRSFVEPTTWSISNIR